jgi:hypothetical protein
VETSGVAVYRGTARTFSLCDAKFTSEATGREQCLICRLPQYCLVIFILIVMYVCYDTPSDARCTERAPVF